MGKCLQTSRNDVQQKNEIIAPLEKNDIRRKFEKPSVSRTNANENVNEFRKKIEPIISCSEVKEEPAEYFENNPTPDSMETFSNAELVNLLIQYFYLILRILFYKFYFIHLEFFYPKKKER